MKIMKSKTKSVPKPDIFKKAKLAQTVITGNLNVYLVPNCMILQIQES